MRQPLLMKQKQRTTCYKTVKLNFNERYPGDVIAIQTRMTGVKYINSPAEDEHHSSPPFHLPVVYQDDYFAIVNKPEGEDVTFDHYCAMVFISYYCLNKSMDEKSCCTYLHGDETYCSTRRRGGVRPQKWWIWAKYSEINVAVCIGPSKTRHFFGDEKSVPGS